MILDTIQEMEKVQLSPLDLLPQHDLREKIVDLVLRGVPENVHSQARTLLLSLRNELVETSVEEVKVVVFGGGTGLSNIIGGDSRQENWAKKPFVGLKEIFPQTRSIVCITDNGGSTGELLKDLPLVAVGDMRHVLLSSIESSNLQKRYNIDIFEAIKTATILAEIFNCRSSQPFSKTSPIIQEILSRLSTLPRALEQYLKYLLEYLFFDRRFAETLHRPHCLGNLLLAAAIYREVDHDISNEQLAIRQELLHKAIFKGMNALARMVGACERAVLPCTSTPAQLRVLYTNGVEIIGEHKLSESRRGFPVDSVQIDYCDRVRVYDEVLADIAGADILILAPGSLYSSIIPVFKVPGLADTVRSNRNALKVLVSNLWVQAGETDLSIADPERKFHVSDMIRAYEKNIPGGTRGLFNEVLCISLNDIPASVLQRYAVEGKVPIFVDKEELFRGSYIPIECGVYSRKALVERGVIQHDPDILAQAIKALYNGRSCFYSRTGKVGDENILPGNSLLRQASCLLPCQRFLGIKEKLAKVEVHCIGNNFGIDTDTLKEEICNILWNHPIIPLHHLDYFNSIHCIDRNNWHRDQQWDNVFSFFDPEDKAIKIRGDQIGVRQKLEIALMIALGESLLGNYALKKEMQDVQMDTISLGRVYHLYLREEKQRSCFLTHEQVRSFLALARMCFTEDENHYTRLINKGEGFTPPGLLMGLMYAWYIDNRLASHIEYKMSVMKIDQTDLIPEQLKMAGRRRKMVSFFKEVVFRQQPSSGEPNPAYEG
ncbi:MAG: YvcK family protein [Desulforhopalus sp.]|nr:YvcK family protein [Desulforhopalus sp.]